MATVVNLPAHRGGTGAGQALGKNISQLFEALGEAKRRSNLSAAFNQYEEGVKQAPNREAAAALEFRIPAGSAKTPADIVNMGRAKQEILNRHHPAKSELFFDISKGLSTQDPIGSFATASAARAKSGAERVASASDIARLRSARNRGNRPLTASESRIRDTLGEANLPSTSKNRNIARRLNRESDTAGIQKRIWKLMRKPDTFIWSKEAQAFGDITRQIPSMLRKGWSTSRIIQEQLKLIKKQEAGTPTAATT